MRDRIINTAKDLFFTSGLRSVTMDDIARKSGISKKTLYAVFADKPELAYAVVASFLRCHTQLLHDCRKDSLDEVDEVLRSAQMPFRMIASINPLFFYEIEKFHQDAWQMIQEYKEQVFLPLVAANLQLGIKSGCFRKDLDVAFTSKIRLEQLIAVLDRRPEAAVSQRLLMQKYSEFYLHAIVSETGKKLLMKYIDANDERN